jgi:hypothetical protein
MNTEQSKIERIPLPKTIKVYSSLTKDILVKFDDGMLIGNVYGNLAMFIGLACLIDPDNKNYGEIAFESEQFDLRDKSLDINLMWREFDDKLTKFAQDERNLSEYRDSYTKHSMIKL